MPILSIVSIALAAVVGLTVTVLVARMAAETEGLQPVSNLPELGGMGWFRQVVEGRLGLGTGSARTRRLAGALLRADLRLKPAEWVFVVIAASALLGLLLGAIFGNLFALGVGFACGVVGCQLFLSIRQRRRNNLFEIQLVDALLTMRSALRAGSSFPQALAAVAQATPAPCGDEFARVIREVDLGLPLDRSLTNMVDRNHSEDLALLVVAVQVHREVGGNLARTVERISRVIQDRLRIRGDVRVLTAQARLSGMALAVLPVLLGVVLSLLSPTYFRPILTDPIGIGMLTIAAVSVVSGSYLLTRVARVDFY